MANSLLAHAEEAGPPEGIGLENELLLTCARTGLESEHAVRLRALVSQDLDWSCLIRAAIWHGTVSPLYWRLRNTCPEAVPKRQLDYLADQFERNHRLKRARTSELLEILDVFQADSIGALVFNAGHLSSRVRLSGQPDLLVGDKDVQRAKALLLGHGYEPHAVLRWVPLAAVLGSECEMLFTRKGDGSDVKLRWGIVPAYFSFSLSPASIRERAVLTRLGGREVWAPSAADSLIASCVLGATRMWERLVWIADVAESVAAVPVEDWALLRERARALGGERMLDLGLHLAKELLGARAPEGASEQDRVDAVTLTLAVDVCRRLFPDDPGWARASPRQRSLFYVRARERSRDRWRFCVRRVLRPTAADLGLQLPWALPVLAYVVRPLRLLGHVGMRALQRLAPPIAGDLSVFRPTPLEYVERMLTLARVGPSDVVYDLGCGDGRIVIVAAKRYGARGVGIEIDPRLVARANRAARREGVQHLVQFVEGDAKTVDLSEATVVTLYLRWSLKIRGLLERALRPGTRVVAFNFSMGDWLPDETQIVDESSGYSNTVYLWRISESRAA